MADTNQKHLKLFKYLYYRLYSWNLKKWGVQDAPQWNALFGVSFMICLNIGIIGVILEIIGFNIFFEPTPIIEILIVANIILGIGYFRFLFRKKYKLIEKEYKNESQEQRKRGTLIVWVYTICSFLILILLAFLVGKIRNG